MSLKDYFIRQLKTDINVLPRETGFLFIIIIEKNDNRETSLEVCDGGSNNHGNYTASRFYFELQNQKTYFHIAHYNFKI